MARITEEGIFALLVVFLIFMVVNFDPSMATVFSLMIIADILIFSIIIKKQTVDYPFEKDDKNRFKSVLESIILFAGFIFIQTVILRLLTPTIQSATQSITTLLSLYSTTTPALANNIFLTVIAFGIVVPFVETRFFFGRLFELIADKMKLRPSLKDGKTWILSIFIGVVFALYHLTARRCGSAATCQNSLLLVTFVFGTLSTLMVAHYRESKQAVLLHVLANMISVLFTLGLLSVIGVTP